jgi:SAM-dependent methyltransferase
MIKSIHPFPARMGPDLAIERLKRIIKPSVVLDPMAGSGTVLRHAAEFGHEAVGRDLDPLAILMARVWTTPIDRNALDKQHGRLLKLVGQTDPLAPMPWIDSDAETQAFVDYWFAEPQRSALRRIAHALHVMGRHRRKEENAAAVDVLRLALSRIIITKDNGASLGRDVSHSRPHKVKDTSNYDVMAGFNLSVQQVRQRLISEPPPGGVNVGRGDARALRDLGNRSIDAVLSSPPYLNAIDYMRAHRLSLVWLGYRVGELRNIRSICVGTERGPDSPRSSGEFDHILESLGEIDQLPSADQGMIARYAEDMYRLMSELARVLKSDGRIFLVVGNSCLRSVFIRNSEGFITAGNMVGLKLTRVIERELPTRKRYLPTPEAGNGALAKRMRTEMVMTFKHR